MNKQIRIQFLFLFSIVLFGGTVHAGCTNSCHNVCDRKVTNDWHRVGGVKGCKVNYGVNRKVCKQVCTSGKRADAGEFMDWFVSNSYAAPPASQCGGTSHVQCDGTPPTGTAKYVYENGVVKVVVASCNDNLSGCKPSTYTTINFDPSNPTATVRICDKAGNCANIAPPPDNVPPVVTITIDWAERLLEYDVVCKDALTFCKVQDRDNYSYDPATGEFRFTVPYDVSNKQPVFNVCDFAGNCKDYPAPFDITPPHGFVSFHEPEKWKNAESFPELKCRLIICEDDNSGCLAVYQNGKDYENGFTYTDTGGAIPVVNVVTDDLDPVHKDQCKLNVCDNAGNCKEYISTELKYDDYQVCKSADGICKACDPGDNDCLCIVGDLSKCRNDGPINCYTNPFHSRCPGTANPVCLLDPLSPGCPAMNPCYPTKIYPQAKCPEDSKRFCLRNPNHYTCNTGCGSGNVTCGDIPKIPTVGGGNN